MKNVLIRAGMFPGQEPDAITCWQKNLIANNSGNILFAESVQRAIYQPGVAYTPSYGVPKEAAAVNERYSAFVLPLANAFRKRFMPYLKAYTALIEQLKIPCIVVGVGAQTNLQHSLLQRSEVDKDVQAFVHAVLDKSHSIGVRGHFTAQYLAQLGFKDRVNVIGCPSMYMHQGQMRIAKQAALPQNPAIAVNMTPDLPENISHWFRSVWKNHPSALYVMQDRTDMALLLWGQPNPAMKKGDATPALLNHPTITRNRARLFFDSPSWISAMRGQDFSIGTRIHGNIAALLAGTPAMVVAHDSRTLEMAEFFHIPHVLGSTVDGNTDLAQLYAQADYGPLERALPEKFLNFCQFLRDNGLEPHYGLETQLQQGRYSPGPVVPITALQGKALRERLEALHQHLQPQPL